MMTSGTPAQADFGDALFGSDGTADPVTPVRPPAVYPDPLADRQPDRPSRRTPAAPDPATRVAEPPPITDEARRLAERQLAARQGRRQPPTSAKSRKPATSPGTARQAQPAAAPVAYPQRSGAPASAPDPVAAAGDPGAHRKQLMERIRAARGPDRKRLIQELLAQGRAERTAVRSGRAANQATADKKSRGGAWLSVLVLVVIFLMSSGAGRELFEALSDLFSGGN